MKNTKSFRAGIKLGEGKINNFSRLIAYFIDWYIATMVAGIPIVLINSFVKHTTDVSQDLSTLPTNMAILAGILGIVFYIGYFVVLELFVYKGQTFGKRIMKIKVVKQDGSNVDFWTIIKREVIGVMLIEGYIANSSSYLRQIVSIATGVNVMDMAVYLFGIISAISILMGMVSTSRKMIHDYIAGTCEISNKEEQQGEAFHA